MKNWKNYILEFAAIITAFAAAVIFLFFIKNIHAGVWSIIAGMWVVSTLIYKRSSIKYENIASDTLKINDKANAQNERLLKISKEINQDNIAILKCINAIMSDPNTDTSKWSKETRDIVSDWTEQKTGKRLQ